MPLEDLNVVTVRPILSLHASHPAQEADADGRAHGNAQARIWRGCADFLKPWTGRVEGLGDDFGSSPEYFNKTLCVPSLVSALAAQC